MLVDEQLSEALMDQIVAWLDRSNVSALAVFATAVLLIAAAIVILRLNRLLRNRLKSIQTRLHLSYEIALTIARVATGALWLLTALLLLDIWGVGLGGLWTLLVSAATVVGVGFLATWTIVSNFTASFFISFWHPFNLGHTVEILPENLKGRVIDRNLIFTILREDGGAVIQIPNNLFFQKIFRVTGSGGQSLFESLESEERTAPGAGNDGGHGHPPRRDRSGQAS